PTPRRTARCALPQTSETCTCSMPSPNAASSQFGDIPRRTTMWAKDRHHRILTLLAAREQVSMENLAEEFGVSRETLRRDIVQLEAEGRLKRVYGGFMRVDVTEPPFQ